MRWIFCVCFCYVLLRANQTFFPFRPFFIQRNFLQPRGRKLVWNDRSALMLIFGMRGKQVMLLGIYGILLRTWVGLLLWLWLLSCLFNCPQLSLRYLMHRGKLVCSNFQPIYSLYRFRVHPIIVFNSISHHTVLCLCLTLTRQNLLVASHQWRADVAGRKGMHAKYRLKISSHGTYIKTW